MSCMYVYAGSAVTQATTHRYLVYVKRRCVLASDSYFPALLTEMFLFNLRDKPASNVTHALLVSLIFYIRLLCCM